MYYLHSISAAWLSSLWKPSMHSGHMVVSHGSDGVVGKEGVISTGGGYAKTQLFIIENLMNNGKGNCI